MSSIDPQVMIRYTDDGGQTYSAEQWFSLGVEGDFRKRVTMYAQGSSQARSWEIVTTDPRSFTIIEGYADVELSDD